MNKLLTPIELEIATTLEGITNVKTARERFYEKYAHDYHNIASQIVGCQITYGATLWDVINDKHVLSSHFAYLILLSEDLKKSFIFMYYKNVANTSLHTIIRDLQIYPFLWLMEFSGLFSH